MRLEQRRHVERVAGQQRRHKTGQVHGRVDSPQVVIGKSWLTPQEVLRPKRFRRLTVEPLSNTVRSRDTDADFDQLNRSPGEVTRNASTFDIFWSLTGGTIRAMQRSGTTRLPRPRTQTCTERLNFRVRVLRGQVDLIAATNAKDGAADGLWRGLLAGGRGGIADRSGRTEIPAGVHSISVRSPTSQCLRPTTSGL